MNEDNNLLNEELTQDTESLDTSVSTDSENSVQPDSESEGQAPVEASEEAVTPEGEISTEADEAQTEKAEGTEEETTDSEPDEASKESDETVVTPAEPEEKPYHERYYLRYRDSENVASMDLEGTTGFLSQIGFDGGELRQARQEKERAQALRNSENGNNSRMHCSYCGAEISGVEFYRMPDGRIRCTSCSNSVVKTKAEIEDIYNRVLVNMENFFGATIEVPVSIEILEERRLKRKVGAPLGDRDDQSVLILGVAINKKKKYSVLIENGAPRISLIATFAHELTHIWQYTHWDNQKKFKKCHKKNRLLIYEGMAKWAEIQYLYLVGETAVATREEMITRAREDEYGVGFCLYDDHYPISRDVMSCEETPFTPGRYPFEQK